MNKKLSDDMLEMVSGGGDVFMDTINSITNGGKGSLKQTINDMKQLSGGEPDADKDETKQALQAMREMSKKPGYNSGYNR